MSLEQFPKSAIDQIQLSARLQDDLISISSTNYNAKLESILKNNFDDQTIDTFIHDILIATDFRPKSASLYAQLIYDLSQNHQINKLINLLKQIFFTPYQVLSTKYIQEEAVSQALLMRKCYELNLISFDEIFEFSKLLKSFKRKYCIQLSFIYVYFMYEFTQKDPSFSLTLCIFCEHKMKSFQVREYFEAILGKRTTLCNNKELWEEHIKIGYPKNSIAGAIVLDNFELLQDICSSPDFDYNQKIFPSLFDPHSLKHKESTLLQFSAIHGSIQCFKYLYLNGSQMIPKRFTDWTITQFATAGGNLEIIHILDQNDISFDKCLEISSIFHQHEIFDWLIDTKGKDINREKVIFKCIESNNIIDFLKCIKCGNDINMRDENICFYYFLRLPLFYAVMNNKIEILKFILASNKIDVNLTNSLGWTALHYAAALGLNKSAELLLENDLINPNIQATQKKEETPIYVAARNGYKEIVQMILNSEKFDPNFNSRSLICFKLVFVFRWFILFFSNALKVAAMNENKEIVDMLSSFKQ